MLRVASRSVCVPVCVYLCLPPSLPWSQLLTASVPGSAQLTIDLHRLRHCACRVQANFVLFDVGSVARAELLYSGLKKQGVLVRYWGSRPDLCTKLRVTVGTRASNEKFVELVSGLLAAEPSSNGVDHKKQKM